MKALIVTTGSIQDLKLVAETESDTLYLKLLSEAGTLSAVSGTAGSSILFRPVSVVEEDYNGNTVNESNSISRFNFVLKQNERKVIYMDFSSNGAAIDLSAYSAIKLQVKPNRSAMPVISLTVGEGLTIEGPELNSLKILFTPEQSALLLLPVYYYDLLFSLPEEINTYTVEGEISVTPSITR